MDNKPIPKRKRSMFLILFRRMETVSDAQGIIRSACILVLLYAMFKAIVAAFSNVALLMDALVIVLVAAPLMVFKNRFAAVAMLVLIALITLDTVIQAFTGRPSVAVPIVVLLLWVSVRAVQAAFRLKRGDLEVDAMDIEFKPDADV